MKIFNPATEEVIKEINEDDQLTIQKKYNALKAGQRYWADQPMDQRIKVIKKFVKLLQSNQEKLAQDLNQETGKPLTEAVSEIKGACYRTKYFIDNAKKILQDKLIQEKNNVQEVITFDPLGVIANISAWNYPYLVGVNVFIPALLAGNAVLYKPSEYATLTGLNIKDLLLQAGVPADVFDAVIGDGVVGGYLLDLPLQGYFFTGSYQTGKAIATKVAHKLVPIGLELGGKDPVYVMEDVTDINQTASALVEGAFYNNGQSCCAVERIYVHENIYDDFVAAYIKAADALSTVAPVTRPQHLNVLMDQVRDAVQRGAHLALGGKRLEKKGNFFAPTVLTQVNHTMKVMRDESFGPIIGIQKVVDDNEALSLMQDTEYGLTAGIYGQNVERAKQLLSRLEVGTGYFNCCDRVSPYLPWSGRRHSGIGSTLSYLGILAFAKPKAYMLTI